MIGIFAAAIVCALVKRLAGEKGIHGAVIKLICGLFLLFTVIAPAANISIDQISDFASDYSHAGHQAAVEGERLTKEAIAAVIKSQTEAYILDKATALDVELKVEVTLSDEDLPCPRAVRLTGKVSPYAKARLETFIAQDLGIEKEHQIWT